VGGDEDPLRDLDEVAHLRFGSVYRSFSSIEDFEEIRNLLWGPGTATIFTPLN
jgi:transcriptional regulator NrdR family protein